jgi:hypothetical protein
LSLVIVAVLDDGPCAVLVLDLLRGGQVGGGGRGRGGGGRLLEVLVVGPIVPAIVRDRGPANITRRPTYFVCGAAILTVWRMTESAGRLVARLIEVVCCWPRVLLAGGVGECACGRWDFLEYSSVGLKPEW